MTQSPNSFVIAIDGPSGAGKGTVARAVSQALGYRHLDTGAMYRAVAWKALAMGLALDDEVGVADLARRASLIAIDGVIVIDGDDVSRAIRSPGIDQAAAIVARLPSVREALVRRQRQEGERGGIVVEGRDIGTVVFPKADVKLYLDATPEERARRRATDPAHTNTTGAGVAEVAVALGARDHLDRTRTMSPLARADDAVLVDTTGRSIDDVVREVMRIVADRVKNRRHAGLP